MSTIRYDPTRTTALRSAYMRNLKGRMLSLRREVWQLVVTEDAFGLNPPDPLKQNAIVTNAGRYAFLTDDAKLAAFDDWLGAQLKGKTLKLTDDKKFVESAYKKGLVRAYTDTHRADLATKGFDFYQGGQTAFLRAAFDSPEALSKIRALATRSFNLVKGLTEKEKSQLNIILAEGVANGHSPKRIAMNMVKRIEVLTKVDAMRIARTEIINAHANGQLDGFAELGIDELEVEPESSTAGDDDVCPECEKLSKMRWTLESARGVIPVHPNCRCSWLPGGFRRKKKPVARRVRKRR